MITNLERYKKDLEALITKADKLLMSMQFICNPQAVLDAYTKALKSKEKAKKVIEELPHFDKEYQHWYSESKSVIRQLLPDRLDDFVRHYEIPKARKELSHITYTIEDFLQGSRITRNFGQEVVVGRSSAVPRFQQQIAILASVKARFESSLFDIRQLVQADIFDSELDAAKELAKNKFGRAAGAMAGVVLERHLSQVCQNHGVSISKKHPAIGDLNNALKDSATIDVPQWRYIQHLADIRNICDHNKSADPTKEQVDDLLSGVAKITKTIF